MKINIIFRIIVYIYFGRLAASQICFRSFRPVNQPYRVAGGHCSFPLGGLRAAVYIPTFNDCCRRPDSGGWGLQYSCQPCRKHEGLLSPWSLWSKCSRSCGVGRQNRRRRCSDICRGVSVNQLFQTRPCSWHKCCPVDGNWAQWSQSTGCSVSCGQGFEYRIRSCSSPRQQCGGKQCVGTGKQYKDCFINCAKWDEWIKQTPCSVTCGNGTQFRQRVCIRPYGGYCNGPSEEYTPCNAGSCPINGNWCKWMMWTPCSSSCSEFPGIRRRVRICSCPFPSSDGSECMGSDRESEQCEGRAKCSINGSWGTWGSWGSCTAQPCSVEQGERNRSRSCNNPAPRLYGEVCLGSEVEVESCMNMSKCKVEGKYGSWSSWNLCGPPCSNCTTRTRTRNCTNPFKDSQTWGVQRVTGNPELICFDKWMIEEEKCNQTCTSSQNWLPCEQQKINLTTLKSFTEDEVSFLDKESSSGGP